ncbi:AraC family transcriptional regulator [Luteibacter aegosomatis]|uniref:AraC family transcriptional regulator n=1 Tax=Luteibacter aegosomatis TaxID=2911537 RepID=UPI001FF75818|nr:AraC family transcriptional regulator [Luteibacter aegosomatis]UPG86295.1 AraC family transcriptional regulator [Luteibacter aegosomatis]
MSDRTEMTDDPITEFLRLAEVESVMSGGFTAGGDWSVRFPPPDKLKFFASARGGCVLRMEGDTDDVPLAEGDVVLLIAPRGFVLCSDPSVMPREAREFFGDVRGGIVQVNEGDDTLHIGGHVRLHPDYEPMLTGALPPWIHVRATAPEASIMRWLIDRMVEESAASRPAAGLMLTQLAHLLFVQILRAHMASGESLRAGWLRAAADPRLAPVLRRIHADPAQPWRLDDMARAAAMSRTVFAAHFKAVAGVAPLAYLTQWRMRLATHALRRGSVPVAVLARDLGYASESAFSHAFKRVVGVSPARFALSSVA